MLPGPPGELIPMLEHYALPALMSTNSRAVIVSKNLREFGLGEGLTAEKLDDLLQGSNPTAATYALQNECFVRVTARASNEEEALTMMQPLIEKIRARLGTYLYTEEDGSLEEIRCPCGYAPSHDPCYGRILHRRPFKRTADRCTGQFGVIEGSCHLRQSY